MKNHKNRPLMLAIAAILNAPHTEGAEIAKQVLPEVKVKAAAEKEPAYKADTSSTGLKFETAIRDIPQSVSVVKEELVKSQNAFNLRDALKNVSGLTIAAGEGGRTGDSITLRGFSANSDTYLDGAKENGQYSRDTFFLDRVEVLKGASSVLFGRGSTGGVINPIAKKPVMGKSFANADFTYGNYDFKRTTLDAGTKLTDNVAVRLNALYQDADSFRDYNYTNRWGVAPSIKVDFTKDTDLTLMLLHQEEDSVFDYGVPMIGGRPADVPVNQFYGFKDDLLQTYDTSVVTAIFNHRFNSDFSVRNTARYGNYDRNYRTLLFGATSGTGSATTIARTQALRESPQQNYYNQTDFTFKKPLFGFNNTLLFGAEVGWEDYSFRSKNSTGVTRVSIYNPIGTSTVGLGRANDFSGVLATDRNTQTNTVAGYVLDQFEITPEWKLLAGGRYDVFQAKQNDNLVNTNNFERTDHQWNPRAGLVWQPKDWQAYYFSYGTSFNPSAEAFSLASNTVNLKPEQSQNLEVGAKIDLFDGRLSATGALFRLEKTNARTTDPTDPTRNILAGEQRTDGFELGLSGDLLPDWSLSATYAYLDAEVVKSNNSATGSVSGLSKSLEGKNSVNVPENSGVVWTSYNITPEWEVGGGVFMSGSRFTDAVNEVALPGYARLDATVAYHHKHFDIQANAFNLLDKVYYESGQTNTALPGVPLSGQLTLRLKY
ncbi:TonB-dependent siderophore receptor [Methylobacter sp. G7]|uniref:TonB-dependent receptor n=1 Tax=Methylobacter sp. G7 TaxID=3230117 RepID=UPI003D8062BC